MRSLARAFPLVAFVAVAFGGALAARAVEPTCVTACQEKVDACGAQCEALADTVYRDPASLQECQLGCAKGLFTSCVERCSETGEVVPNDYGLVAEHPDHVPAPPPEPAEPAEPPAK